MSSLPDFSNTTTFPDFSSLPLADSSPSPENSNATFLLGTILENMTLGANPTFICKDRSGVSFAVTIQLPEKEEGKFPHLKGFKKGHTIVVKDARRFGVKDGKQGSVRVEVESVEVIPASGENLFEMKEREVLGGEDKRCQCCGKEEEGKMSRCKGCESVWYCNKECQTKGWSEGGHKSECKILKAANTIFS